MTFCQCGPDVPAIAAANSGHRRANAYTSSNSRGHRLGKSSHAVVAAMTAVRRGSTSTSVMPSSGMAAL